MIRLNTGQSTRYRVCWVRSLLKRMWADIWILNTILFTSCTILFIGRVADKAWLWATLAGATIAVLVWQGVLGWRSSAKRGETSRRAEDSPEAT